MDMERVEYLESFLFGDQDSSRWKEISEDDAKDLIDTIKQQQEQIERYEKKLREEKELVIDNIEYARTTFGSGATAVSECEFLKKWQEDTRDSLNEQALEESE